MSELAAIIEDILALHAEEDEIKESRKRAYAAAQAFYETHLSTERAALAGLHS